MIKIIIAVLIGNFIYDIVINQIKNLIYEDKPKETYHDKIKKLQNK